MGEVVYRSQVHIRREKGPLRYATIPGKTEPVAFGTHGDIAAHYGLDPSEIEPHATTIDYVVAAAGG
jgi:hypothetical protein